MGQFSPTAPPLSFSNFISPGHRTLAYTSAIQTLAISPDTSVLIWEMPQRRGLMAKEQKTINLPSHSGKIWVLPMWEFVTRLQLLSRSPIDEAKVKTLINQLDSPKFAEREKATATLSLTDSAAQPLLKKAFAETASEEVRNRLQTAIDHPEAANLRLFRSIEILEMINSEESRKLLSDLAQGKARVDLQEVASCALKRVERR